MATIKYLKHLNNAITVYYSGRPDFDLVTSKPDDLLLYNDIVDEDPKSENYNYAIWETYIKNNWWTVITINVPEPVVPIVVPSYAGIWTSFNRYVYYNNAG